jgi:phage terminase large subunit-like protein
MDLAETLAQPDVLEQLKALPPEKRLAYLWRAKWLQTAHRHQIVPHGDWSIWLMLAGRGAGKTRAAAEQIGWWAWSEPKTRWLVAAPTSGDVRATCFEGDSGLLSVIPKPLIADYNKAYHELKLINGSLIKGIPAHEPERFRGPQFHGSWCCIPGTLISTPQGDLPIEKIKAGDFVLNRYGARKVTAAGLSRNPNELVRIDCGETSLTVTVDHPILVGDQWVAAGDIKRGDRVWGISTSGADTHIASSMSRLTAPSRLGGSSITKTKTRPTTSSQIWRLCRGAGTRSYTRAGGLGQRLKSKRLQLRWLRSGLQSLLSVCTASASFFLTLRAGLASSAPAVAWSGGGATSSSQSLGYVRSVPSSMWHANPFSGTAADIATASPQCGPIALKPLVVEGVERLPNSATYNLTVEGEHEFIANGIVVHNCDELAAWDYIQEAWDQIQFGVRLGSKTRTVITTTPRPKDLIMELMDRDGDDVIVTTASTYANIDNLSENFRRQILQYEGTKLGRQEIYAEIIDPEDGGIVKRDMFRLWPDKKEFPEFEYIVQSYDCATSEKTQNDPTACSTWGVFKPMDGPMSVMLIDCWQERLQYPDLRPKVVEEYETVYGDGKKKKRVDLILIEDKSAGISLIQDLQRAHLPVRA